MKTNSNSLPPKSYNYTFHYNYHTGLWAALPRGEEKDYWNNGMIPRDGGKALFNSDINSLVDAINNG